MLQPKLQTNFSRLRIYIDGASRGNPGESAAGVVMCDFNGNVINKFSKYLGVATNNQAEYSALIFALEKANEFGAADLLIYLDSEVLYKQLKGEYRIRNKKLKEMFEVVRGKIRIFSSVNFEWLPREKNKIADKLAQKAINLKI